MTVVLTKEYLDMLRALLFERTTNMERSVQSNRHDERLSDTATRLFVDDGIAEAITSMLFSCLNRSDAQTAIRAIPLCRGVVELLHNDDRLTDQAAEMLMVSTLQSLRVHGHDEIALSPLLLLVFSVYSMMRRKSNAVLRVIVQLPDCSEETATSFDVKVRQLHQSTDDIPEKNKRDMVRKLCKGIIGVRVGEESKRPIMLRRLGPLSRKPKKERRLSEEDDEPVGIENLFNPC